MTENWLPVEGYEGLYEVSDGGRVRSRHKGSPKILAASVRGRYPTVCLAKGGAYKTVSVHRLVLGAFVGSCPEGQECRHLNDVKDDNRLENLAWGERRFNVNDQVRNGLHANARKAHCKQGHEFTDQNTRITPKGRRSCRTCEYERGQRRRTPRPDHCPKGHEYTVANTYYEKGRWRRCRACKASQARVRSANKGKM